MTEFIKSVFYIRHNGKMFVVEFKNGVDGKIHAEIYPQGGTEKDLVSISYKYKTSAHKTDAINLVKNYGK